VGTRVTKGGTVTLIVSKGPHRIAVPQVTGVALAAAQAALKHAGLIPGQVKSEPSATIQDGIVISTNPGSGVSWPQTRPVTLVVSAGPPLPNLVGQQKAAAEQWAQANGVSLNEVAVNSTQPAGTIIHQSPAPGGAFTHSQVITIDVSNGPQMVAVPSVDGMNVADAEQTLKQAGFQVNIIRTGPLDNVFTYSPNGQAPQGSTITLWVGLP
jgi:beta-lactam-binding protein with PASTA domain